MLKAARVSVLILLLACSARAGYMQTGGSPGGTPPPPSDPATTMNEPLVASQETSPYGIVQGEAPGVLTQVVLEVFVVLPSLF